MGMLAPGVAPEVPDGSELPGARAAAITGAAYGVLLILGVVLGVLGGFSHAWYLQDIPIAAVGWVVALFALPWGMGRLMGTRLAALLPMLSWLLVSFVLSGRRPEGDLTIAGDLAGYVYLYGGMLASAVAVLLIPSTGGSWLLRQNVRIK